MSIRTHSVLLVAALVFAGCDDTTGSGPSADVEVVFVNRTLYADGFPAMVFTVENRGRVAIELVRIDVDAIRAAGPSVSTTTQVVDLAPGEQAESEPAVFSQLDSHSDYRCYRYRVRAIDSDADVLSDETSDEVCP